MSRELIPLAANPLSSIVQSVVNYEEIHPAFASDVLYILGLMSSESAPPLEDGQSLRKYIEDLEFEERAKIEGLGVAQGRKLEELFACGSKLILYEQYISGRWRLYAQTLGVDRWSPYVTHLIDEGLGLSESEGRRWATGLEVIARLYADMSKERFGLLYIGDEVVDSETGEVSESIEGLPPTAQDCIIGQFSRFSREAGIRLRDLFKEINALPFTFWGELLTVKEEGCLDDAELAKERYGWNREAFYDRQQLYRVILEIRRILKLAATPTMSNKQVNQEATGGKSIMPDWELPEDTPPQWAAFLEQQFPEKISSTGSAPMGRRYVQIRMLAWPVCQCGDVLPISPLGAQCSDCGPWWGKSAKIQWASRTADEHGRYSDAWENIEEPDEDLTQGIPESMDINDLRVSLWELTVALEDLDD